MAALEALSRTKLVNGLRAARGRLASIRDAAEVGAQRLTIGGSAVAAAYGVGRLEEWGKQPGNDLTIGDSEITWPTPVAGVAAVVGAFGGKMLGDTVANVVFGIGVGGLCAEATLLGVKHQQESLAEAA